MELREDLDQIAAAAAGQTGDGETVAAVIPVESAGRRVYLCAFRDGEKTTWLLLDAGGRPIEDRAAVREAASLVALCEVAEDHAGGGGLDELRSRLIGLRLTENPPGLDEAVAAVDELERVIGAPPRIASTDYLESVGAAVRGLEGALGEGPGSPFAEAMKSATGAIEQFTDDVQANYRRGLT
jgi:hypothetical protein